MVLEFFSPVEIPVKIRSAVHTVRVIVSGAQEYYKSATGKVT